MTKAGVCLVSVVLGAACGVGDEGPGGPDPNPNGIKCSAAFTTSGSFTEDPTNRRPLDPLGPDGEMGTADDNTVPVGGCWPVGTWTFTAVVDPVAEVVDADNDGDPDRCGEVSGTSPPGVEQSYSFKVTRTEDPSVGGLRETYQYLGTSPNFFSVLVTEGGGGECEGVLEFKSADSKEWWTLNPNICTSANCQPPSNTIAGSGDYTLYLESQPF